MNKLCEGESRGWLAGVITSSPLAQCVERGVEDGGRCVGHNVPVEILRAAVDEGLHMSALPETEWRGE
jgi:hypothetical protein